MAEADRGVLLYKSKADMGYPDEVGDSPKAKGRWCGLLRGLGGSDVGPTPLTPSSSEATGCVRSIRTSRTALGGLLLSLPPSLPPSLSLSLFLFLFLPTSLPPSRSLALSLSLSLRGDDPRGSRCISVGEVVL